MFKTLICILLASSTLVSSAFQGRAGEGEDSAFPGLPLAYEGVFYWPHAGEQSQHVIIDLEPPLTEAGGILVARGTERYSNGKNYLEIAISVRIDLRTLRFELTELPAPSANAQDSSVGEPMWGSLSPDLRTVVGPDHSHPSAVVHPDFVLRAKPMPPRLAAR